ncbi:MAG: hypothetical protein V3T70_10690 [Phycisphaerae bacterium]
MEHSIIEAREATIPATTGDNGRLTSGRFSAGNQFDRGNPHAKRVKELRALLKKTVSKSDLNCVVRKIVQEAKAGDPA